MSRITIDEVRKIRSKNKKDRKRATYISTEKAKRFQEILDAGDKVVENGLAKIGEELYQCYEKFNNGLTMYIELYISDVGVEDRAYLTAFLLDENDEKISECDYAEVIRDFKLKDCNNKEYCISIKERC